MTRLSSKSSAFLRSLFLLTCFTGAVEILGGNKNKKRFVEANTVGAYSLLYFVMEVDHLDVSVKKGYCETELLNNHTFICYNLFLKELSKVRLRLFKDEALFNSFTRILSLLRIKIYNQPEFIPAKNLDLWLKSENLFKATIDDILQLEDFAFKTIFLFYDFLIPLSFECEELNEADRVEINQYNNQLNELKKDLEILHAKKLDNPKLNNDLLETAFNKALDLLEKYPMHLACCDKEDIRTILWLALIDYFLLAEKQFCEQCLPSRIIFNNFLQNVISILQRYFVILSDNPKEQMEKLKVFCKQIGLECQATEERTEEEDNGLTPSTTPSTSPVPPNETPSPSTTPPLRPTEQPMPVRPSTITRAARRPTTSFASEVLRLFGW